MPRGRIDASIADSKRCSRRVDRHLADAFATVGGRPIREDYADPDSFLADWQLLHEVVVMEAFLRACGDLRSGRRRTLSGTNARRWSRERPVGTGALTPNSTPAQLLAVRDVFTGVRSIKILVTMALLSALTPAAASSKPSSCALRGSKTLAQSEYARVYAPARVKKPPATAIGRVNVYGCVFRTGRRHRLDGGRSAPVNAAPVRLNGRYVAFVRGIGSGMGEAPSIRVFDLKAGRLHREAEDPGFGDPDYAVTDLVVTAGGAAAWIVDTQGPNVRGGSRPEVHTLDADGRRIRDLATETEPIEFGSMALAGATVYWTKGTAPQSYRLRR